MTAGATRSILHSAISRDNSLIVGCAVASNLREKTASMTKEHKWKPREFVCQKI